nr:FAD:protein FMN transferase [Leifsonia psychrotolerans]
MGTVASLICADELPSVGCLAAVARVFTDHDELFSLYRPNSELSRLARGEITLAQTSADVRDCYAQANDWRLQTNGAFTAHRPDGLIDLSGIVKAASISRAADVLHGFGVTDALLDVGGDALALGTRHGRPWRAGIVDPADATALLCSVDFHGEWAAVATSGTAERGEHVWRTGPDVYRQVTVLAADIVTADVLATAVLSGGPEMRDDATDRWNVDVLTVDRDGELTLSARLRDLTAQPR